MTKHIVHIGKYFAPFKGGIERAMEDLMCKQKQQGFKVSAIVHHHDKFKSTSVEKSRGMKIIRLAILGRLSFVPIAMSSLFFLNKLIKDLQPQILHLHLPNALCLLLLFCPACKNIPWVIHWHSDILGDRPNWRIRLAYPLFSILEKQLLKRAARIIVTSQPYLETSQPLKPWERKCTVVPIGLSDLAEENKRSTLANSKLNIICVGRFTYYKGQRYLIEAVHQLITQGHKLHLTLVGDGSYRRKIIEKINKLNLSSLVTIVSGVDDTTLNNLLQKSDLVCLPSIERTEAFGVVLLEAMRARKPCICTSVKGSGMSYIVRNNITGKVVKPSNAKALATAIEDYLEKPRLLQDHGDNGRARLEQDFSIEKVTSQIRNIYEKIQQK